MDSMIPIYCSLIKSGDKTLEQVPKKIRDKVENQLNANEAD
ncbi:CD1375 family protein [Brevibacillus laterosporus]|nr:CD1375 family protein [Brevibacillus laterosporus]MCR8940378.1 CD1375 family protein [Brevibacillus laterosporus]MCZ0843017.1 CD1375 family protein [Brevibacillus laterosporus]MCZ0847382.1 CD1375 family protein [Brevibacillus laterosporus]MED1909552.1 CD1375 family protein [Brevibacillus laterosporus]